jgi:hypothetical protein
MENNELIKKLVIDFCNNLPMDSTQQLYNNIQDFIDHDFLGMLFMRENSIYRHWFLFKFIKEPDDLAKVVPNYSKMFILKDALAKHRSETIKEILK